MIMKKKAAKRDIFCSGDIIIIIFAVLLAFSTFFFIPRKGRTVTVTVDGKTVFTGTLDTDAVFVTPDGHNEITISDGRVYMSRADCPDKICLHMGYATPSRPIVCLPNGVIVTVTDSGKTDPDDFDSVIW